MKTDIFKLVPMLLLLAGGLVSCEDKNTSEEVIEPILPNNDAVAFFNEHLPDSSGIRSECFFVNDKENKCAVINSVGELRKNIFCSSAILPEIDFESYTLIIGQSQMSGTAYSVDTQNIVVDAKKAILNINVRCPEGSYAVICPLYYWGIYPKLKDKLINVNIINECDI